MPPHPAPTSAQRVRTDFAGDHEPQPAQFSALTDSGYHVWRFSPVMTHDRERALTVKVFTALPRSTTRTW